MSSRPDDRGDKGRKFSNAKASGKTFMWISTSAVVLRILSAPLVGRKRKHYINHSYDFFLPCPLFAKGLMIFFPQSFSLLTTRGFP